MDRAPWRHGHTPLNLSILGAILFLRLEGFRKCQVLGYGRLRLDAARRRRLIRMFICNLRLKRRQERAQRQFKNLREPQVADDSWIQCALLKFPQMRSVQPSTVCEFLKPEMLLSTEFTNPVPQSFQITLL